MQRGILLLAAAAAVSAQDFHTIAAKVNSMHTTWKAEAPSRFNTTEDVKKLCGTWLVTDERYVRLPEATHFTARAAVDLPTDFDARTQWPNCTVIATVRDQSSCGSCWAFGSTETFEDRRCIHKGVNTEMSTEDTASCCSGLLCGFSMGCNGGQPGAALSWMTRTGVVTGGDYGDKTTCRPYTMAPCAHHVTSSKYPACPSSEYPTPKCTAQCQTGYSQTYSADKVKGASSYSVTGVEKIMTALQQGPVSAAFTVYADFPTYKSGVYHHTSGSSLGGHAVEIVGYGVESGTNYWLVKNSWNEEWGEGGFFKIRRGHNECGIENDINAIDF
eukprot:TRINITY_DN33_c0_g1_i6.p1 TRINITY_DN33_c0_g1~~TRINITY_DN33_c0_g1_i6.p1  ORF type:complete len:346 (+),score=139.13 TRINITY_DN33_c0_g1_i6:49-1038(+)